MQQWQRKQRCPKNEGVYRVSTRKHVTESTLDKNCMSHKWIRISFEDLSTLKNDMKEKAIPRNWKLKTSSKFYFKNEKSNVKSWLSTHFKDCHFPDPVHFHILPMFLNIIDTFMFLRVQICKTFLAEKHWLLRHDFEETFQERFWYCC